MTDWRREARRALREYPRAKKRNGEADRATIAAVDAAMQMQSAYYNGQERMRMVRMVYFKQTHTLAGAAAECGYSIETVRKWNLEIMTAVYVGLLHEKGPGD